MLTVLFVKPKLLIMFSTGWQKKALGVFILFCSISMLFGQGVTTGSMNGRITDETGEGLIGANVLVKHIPTGAIYGDATDFDGYYRINNMKVGGPYTVTFSYTGYEETVIEGITISLGQSFKLNQMMSENALALEEVVVVAEKNQYINGGRDGQKTVINEDVIDNVPTLSRSITDYARLNPLATISEGSDGFSFSLAGQNNRYNTIYIDGAVSNDVFGLAASGTNGGQTGVAPISVDAIEQFTVAVAPFDIRQSGFAGGSVNAVTRSGTNEFSGSAYYLFRNQNFAGKTPTDNDNVPRTKLEDFSSSIYGFRLGGPIVKDKLFFFVNAEIQRELTPSPFDLADYDGNSTQSTIDSLYSYMEDGFGYDLGQFGNNETSLKSEKVLAKIDWNISDAHKFNVRYSYVKADNLEARTSSPSRIGFLNGSEAFLSKTHSVTMELNSLFKNSSNSFIAGFTYVDDDRDPSGDPFPTVSLEDGPDGNISLGAEKFSTANLLNQKVLTIKNDYSLYRGRQTFLFGVNFEYFDAGNLFIPSNYGEYTWEDSQTMTGVERFLANEPADQYNKGFSQVDNAVGDESQAIAAFKTILLGLYVQDEYQFSDRFKATLGLRIDMPFWPTDQPGNEDFNNITLPAIEAAGYDLEGARTGQFIKTQVAFAPRLSFNWDVTGKGTTQLRGGVGLFTSRVPLVWAGGAYNNYGFNTSSVSAVDVLFDADVNNQPVAFDNAGNPIYNVDLDNPVPGGDIDIFAENFKLPQVMKVNLAVDQLLPGGIVATLEGIYTRNFNSLRVYNYNLKPSVRSVTNSGGDTRPLFNGTNAGFGDDPIEPTYVYISMMTNDNKGYGYNFAVSLNKVFDFGFNLTANYSLGKSFVYTDATSSTNKSNWRGSYNFNGRNSASFLSQSNFSSGQRISGQVSYAIEYLKCLRSGVSLNFNIQKGGYNKYFTYAVGASNFRYVDDGGFNNTEQFYVPETIDDIPMRDLTVDGVTYTPQEQWEILDRYIEDRPEELGNYRGGYVERNTGTLPWETVLDLRFMQDFFVTTKKGKRNTLTVSLDIFNFTNLLSKNWGRIRFSPSFGAYRIVSSRNNLGYPPGTSTDPEYTLNPDLIRGEDPWESNIDDNGLRSSRWQMQLGVRYTFN